MYIITAPFCRRTLVINQLLKQALNAGLAKAKPAFYIYNCTMKSNFLKSTTCIIALLMCLVAPAQQKEFDRLYHFKHSSSYVQDKNFYLLTVIEQTPEVSNIVHADSVLAAITNQRIATITSSITNCKDSITCFTNGLIWTEAEIDKIADELKTLYSNNRGFVKMVKEDLRPSVIFNCTVR